MRISNISLSAVIISWIFIFFAPFPFGAESYEYTVGDDQGWCIPPGSNPDFYNNWASNHRFKVEDTLRFEFKDDSVMVVTEDDYNQCMSTQPIFYSNDGNSTLFTLDSPFMYYFISGVSGHCERGQKMIVKVLDDRKSTTHPPPLSPAPPSDEKKNSSHRINRLFLMWFNFLLSTCIVMLSLFTVG